MHLILFQCDGILYMLLVKVNISLLSTFFRYHSCG